MHLAVRHLFLCSAYCKTSTAKTYIEKPVSSDSRNVALHSQNIYLKPVSSDSRNVALPRRRAVAIFFCRASLLLN